MKNGYTSKPDVIVIGAGAAGIMAAWRAASMGAKVLVVEKTRRIGTKILISGGGKCNIAHDGPIESVIRAFRPNEARFIRPSVYRFPNQDIIGMFTDRGLRVYTRPDGRVFPVDQTAKDVVAILEDYLADARVQIAMNTPVAEILAQDGVIQGIRTGSPFEAKRGYQTPVADRPMYGAKALLSEVLQDGSDEGGLPNQTILCSKVILAVGGSSYPNSGTTGDGWPWARTLGHTVERLHAALAPMYLELDPFDPAKSGLALRDIVLKARLGGKEIARWRNDMLFTHQGVSGPTVLGISRIVAERIGEGEVKLEVDLVPDRTSEEIGQALLSENPRRMVATHVGELVPERYVADVLKASGIPADTVFAKLDKKSRNRLVHMLKAIEIGTVRHVSLEKGEVVAGGVRLDEVDPQTMRSNIVQGLYLCGEVLDIAGPVGGYNLQSAFATGFVAGETAALDAIS